MKKYFAAIKYLFFPFLMANSTGSDFTAILHSKQIVNLAAQSAHFQYLGANEGFWKMNAGSDKTQVACCTFLSSTNETTNNNSTHQTNTVVEANCEFLIVDDNELEQKIKQ